MLISEAFQSYAEDVIVFRNQSKKTEENHFVCMKCLLVFFGDVPIESLTFQRVRMWKQALDKRVSIATSREYIIRLRVVLTYLNMNGHNVLNPEAIAVPKRPEKVPEFITEQDVSKLIEVSLRPARGYPAINRYRNAAVISLFYASGIRVSELAAMNKADIREDGSFTVIGKGKKPRLCFTDQRTKELIREYLALRVDSNPALFIANETGNRVRTGNIQRIFRFISLKSNMSVHPHTLRHSFATNLLRNNCNIRYVQALLGHSSLETTQMYTHVVNEDLHKVYRLNHTV